MKRLIFVFMIASTVMLYAQESISVEKVRKITVDDAVILAADNNISLKRKRISLNTAERKNKTSWNGVSPSLSLSGGLSKPLDGIITDMKAQTDYSYQIGASASLSLTPSLYTTIKDAKLKYENEKISYEDAVRQIELSVRKLFYNLLYTQESMNLQRRNMETARLRYENNRDRYNRGQLSELDLLQSQYSYESQRPTLDSTEIAYQNNLASFKQTLGIPLDEKIELSGSLADAVPPESFSVSQTVDELPSIKKLQASIEQQKNTLFGRRLSVYGPTISASYSYGLSGNDKTKELKKHQENHSISLNVRIPLDGAIPWSSNAQSISDQKALLADLELQLENERTAATLNLQNSIKNIMQKQNQMNMLNQNVEIAQKA